MSNLEILAIGVLGSVAVGGLLAWAMIAWHNDG